MVTVAESRVPILKMLGERDGANLLRETVKVSSLSSSLSATRAYEAHTLVSRGWKVLNCTPPT